MFQWWEWLIIIVLWFLFMAFLDDRLTTLINTIIRTNNRDNRREIEFHNEKMKATQKHPLNQNSDWDGL